MKKDELKKFLEDSIVETSFSGLGRLTRGKVRDIYEREGDETLCFVTTDRVSAFDRVITTIPLKGALLNAIAYFWFKRSSTIVPNHLVAMPHPNVMKVKKLKPIDVEMVVRAYITGVTSTSLWTHYSRGERVIAGNRLPEGLKKNEKLPEPIITPSTKARVGHDVTVSPEELISAGIVERDLYERMAETALALFRDGAALCATRGLILVDTKYEFGLDQDGTLTLMDEIHTPDSSRFWDLNTYKEAFSRGEDPPGFDKEYIRTWLKGVGFSGEGEVPPVPDEVRLEAAHRYMGAYLALTGEEFKAPYSSATQSLAEWAASEASRQ